MSAPASAQSVTWIGLRTLAAINKLESAVITD